METILIAFLIGGAAIDVFFLAKDISDLTSSEPRRPFKLVAASAVKHLAFIALVVSVVLTKSFSSLVVLVLFSVWLATEAFHSGYRTRTLDSYREEQRT